MLAKLAPVASTYAKPALETVLVNPANGATAFARFVQRTAWLFA